MQLDQVFDMGHSLAHSKNPLRYVLFVPEGTDRPAGYYEIERGELDAASVTKHAEFDRLGRRILLRDLLRWKDLSWYPDPDYCWCEECVSARQMRMTLED